MAKDEELMITLFEGESLPDTPDDAAATMKRSDEQVNAKYAVGEQRIVTEQARYPLHTIPQLLEGENYTINPEFQRRRRWDDVKKSRLIESFIMNVPIPPVFLYEVQYSVYEVMDGQQRLSTIWDFYRSRFALTGLTEWPELDGRTYETLPEQVRAGIDRRYLSSIILLHETTKDPAEQARLKRLVFERINSGGVRLGEQEARNALLAGPMNSLCVRLARNPEFCRMWEIPEPDDAEITCSPYLSRVYGAAPGADARRWEPPESLRASERYQTMEDVELVLRFFAYRHIHARKGRPRKGFWDDFLAAAKRFPPSVHEAYDDLFTRTVSLVYKLFGDEALHLFRERTRRGERDWTWVNEPTVVVYEPLMLAASQLLDRAKPIEARAAHVAKARDDFYRTNADAFDGRKVNPSDVRERNRLMLAFLLRFTE